MTSNIYKEWPAQHWCFSWWHKIRYGTYEKVTPIIEGITTVEHFCKKCNKKVDGYTHFFSASFSK